MMARAVSLHWTPTSFETNFETVKYESPQRVNTMEENITALEDMRRLRDEELRALKELHSGSRSSSEEGRE